jgi:hypothetical protein
MSRLESSPELPIAYEDTQQYSVAFDAIAKHFVPGHPESLRTVLALEDYIEAKAYLLMYEELPMDVVDDMFYNAVEEVNEMHGSMARVTVRDFR